jgi:hypothetical protein
MKISLKKKTSERYNIMGKSLTWGREYGILRRGVRLETGEGCILVPQWVSWRAVTSLRTNPMSDAGLVRPFGERVLL